MFDRLQKPFLTVETGEAYQPIRLSYYLRNKDGLVKALESMQCVVKNPSPDSWTWFWKAECDDLRFESVDSFRKNTEFPLRLGTITIRGDHLYINLPSFKRACIAISFFYNQINDTSIVQIHRADFINKVFAIDERLPHGFAELFNEDELERIVHQREEDYHKVQEQCEHATTPEQAFTILSEYTKSEAKKTLPFAERFVFEQETDDAEVMFLGFYIFLRGRELVAIKRWYGETGYTLADAADETFDQVFGGMGIDIIE